MLYIGIVNIVHLQLDCLSGAVAVHINSLTGREGLERSETAIGNVSKRHIQ